MAHEIQFARGTFYKAGGGMAHLKHALRDKYDSERIPEPNIRLQVLEMDSYKMQTSKNFTKLMTTTLTTDNARTQMFTLSTWLVTMSLLKRRKLCNTCTRSLKADLFMWLNITMNLTTIRIF